MIGSLQQTIAAYRAQLLAKEAQALAVLAQAHSATLATIQPRLDALMKQLQDAMDAGPVNVSWLYEQKRLEIFLQWLTGQIDHYAALAQTYTLQLQHQGVQIGKQAGSAALQATVPDGVVWQFALPDESAIVQLVGATQAGSPLASLFNGFGAEVAQEAGKALITGLTLGNNPRLVAKDVQQALNISYNRAAVIARTEMLRAYRGAQMESYRANSDVVDQWRWTCALSPRTCAACLAMDGSLHDLSEDMESHPCCRCTQTPVTKGWDEILAGTGIDTSDIPDTPSPTDWQTGADWFAKQPADVQQGILGKQAYQLYQDGAIDLSDMVTKTSDPQWGGGIQQTSVKELVKKK